MPSSLIFAGLVVLWLLILVPAVARHQQEVARPSMAALSGRVLERPRRAYRTEEVDDVHDTDDDVARDDIRAAAARIPAAREAEEFVEDDAEYDGDHDAAYEDGEWERPAPRYRPGRGGFDPAAAALTARARYAFRQRLVLGLLVAAVGSALVALLAAPMLWWLHGAIDIVLVGYLGYLRQQVRMEEAIRDRRAARMTGTRRPTAAVDPELDEWARRGRDVARRPEPPAARPVDEEDDDLVDDVPERVSGTGEPIGPIASTAHLVDEPALPRLTPAPPPPLPAGTTVVDGDLDDPGLHDLDAPARPDYRRAVGE